MFPKVGHSVRRATSDTDAITNICDVYFTYFHGIICMTDIDAITNVADVFRYMDFLGRFQVFQQDLQHYTISKQTKDNTLVDPIFLHFHNLKLHLHLLRNPLL